MIVPIIGALVLIYFAVQDSQEGSNEYGPNPKGLACRCEFGLEGGRASS
jgi:uncharacterized membrane protein YhaH (DUF805 family)